MNFALFFSCHVMRQMSDGRASSAIRQITQIITDYPKHDFSASDKSFPKNLLICVKKFEKYKAHIFNFLVPSSETKIWTNANPLKMIRATKSSPQPSIHPTHTDIMWGTKSTLTKNALAHQTKQPPYPLPRVGSYRSRDADASKVNLKHEEASVVTL